MTSDFIVIAKNVPITFKTTALAIYISSSGQIAIALNASVSEPPKFSLDYLEFLCCRFYFGGKPHPCAIADILFLNQLLTKREYGDFYKNLAYNLACNVTLIAPI